MTSSPTEPSAASVQRPPPADRPEESSGRRARRLGRAGVRAIRRPDVAYTLLVRTLRVLAPVGLAAGLAAIVVWPRMQPEPAPPPPELRSARVEMVKPRYQGIDTRDRPFTVTSDNAERSPAEPDLVILDRPVAEMTLKDGRWLAVKAGNGQYRESSSHLLLTGGVELFHDSGNAFATDHAYVDLETGTAWSDRQVSGHGPRGEIAAAGVRISDEGRTVVFTGPARLLLRNAGGTK